MSGASGRAQALPEGREARLMSNALDTAQGTRTAADWAAVLDRYQVHHLVLDASADRDLCEYFSARPGWTVDLEAHGSVLLSYSDLLARRD